MGCKKCTSLELELRERFGDLEKRLNLLAEVLRVIIERDKADKETKS